MKFLNRLTSTPLVLGVLAIFAGAVQTRAASTVYTIDQTITSAQLSGNPLQSNTVNGTLTTDGTIGAVAPADVMTWNLDLIDGLNSANNVDLTPGNSTLVEDTGSALTATATGLFFDFSGSGEFLIQGTQNGAYSGYSYFCFSTGGACAVGETISPQYIYTDGTVLTGSAAPIGNQPLNPPASSSPSPAATPEPATLALMGAGIGVIGLMRRCCGKALRS